MSKPIRRSKKRTPRREKVDIKDICGHKLTPDLYRSFLNNVTNPRGDGPSTNLHAVLQTVRHLRPSIRAEKIANTFWRDVSDCMMAIGTLQTWPWHVHAEMLRQPVHGLLLDTARKLQSLGRRMVELEKAIAEEEGGEQHVQDWLKLDARLERAGAQS